MKSYTTFLGWTLIALLLVSSIMILAVMNGCKKDDSPVTPPPPPTKISHTVVYSWSMSGATKHRVTYWKTGGTFVRDSINVNGFVTDTLYSGDRVYLWVSASAPMQHTLIVSAATTIDDTIHKTLSDTLYDYYNDEERDLIIDTTLTR